MRRRLLALALVAAAAATSAPAAQAALQFERRCQGKADSRCYHDLCGIASCTRRDCLVYSGILSEGNGALCVGLARPGDPVET